MHKKNLFIVNTPFHLLTSFILSKSIFKEDENYLALIHPHGYEKWGDSCVMNYMSSKDCGYKEVFPLIQWMTSKNKSQTYCEQVQTIKQSIGKLGIETIFLGSDIDIQNQLLVAALGKDRFCRYEDGLYSYYNENRRRSWSHMFFHKMKIHGIEWLAGIKDQLYINTSTASDSKAGIADFMYKPALLQRYSPNSQEITNRMIQTAIADLVEKAILIPKMKKKTILYLSQPLVEQGTFTLEEEFGRLEKLVQGFAGNMTLLYKSHPNDSAGKFEFYKKNLPQMEFFTSIEPVELLFACEENLLGVISYQSTALMFPDKFAKHKIKAMSLVHFYKEPLHPAYIEIMQGAGVVFPKNMEAVTTELCL